MSDRQRPQSLAEYCMGQLRLLASSLAQGLHTMAWSTVRPFPRGMWTCGDGRQVIFDRSYELVWEYLPNGICRAADPHEWVEDITRRKFFFWNDRLLCYQEYRGMKRLGTVLVEDCGFFF
jgi:hypothetical protein